MGNVVKVIASVVPVAGPLLVNLFSPMEKMRDEIESGARASAPVHAPDAREVPRPDWFPNDGIPNIFITGGVGDGKSTIMNALMGYDNRNPNRIETSGMGECTGAMDTAVKAVDYIPKVYI